MNKGVIYMKKKIVLKKWVEVVLEIVLFMSILIGASECDNMRIFIISHLGAGLVMIIVGMILVKYGRDFD